MAQRRLLSFFLGLLGASHSLILPPLPRVTTRFREPRSRFSSRAGVTARAIGSLEDAMIAFLDELPPVRLEKPRTGKNRRTKLPLPLTRAAATKTLAALSSSRGVAGNQAALREHLHACAAAGYFDLTVAGFVGPYRAEARNLRSAEATLARASEIAKAGSGTAAARTATTDTAANAAAAALTAAEREARADAELTLLAAACAFANGDAVLGRKVLRTAAVPVGAMATSALVQSLAQGSQTFGGGSAFQLALRLRSDASAPSSSSLSSSRAGGNSDGSTSESTKRKMNKGDNSIAASNEGLSANALGEMFRALRQSGPLIARPPAWSTASDGMGMPASGIGDDSVSIYGGDTGSKTGSSSADSVSSSEGNSMLDLELCGAGSGVLCSGSEAELGDPRERLALALDLLEDMRAQGLRPHPEAGSAVAMSAFRAALDEGWGTDATTDDDDDDNNENTQMQWKQQQKPQGKRKAGVSSSSSKGEAYVNRRGSTGGPSTSIRGPLTGGSGSPSGSATGTTASATTTTTTTSARHPARAAFRSVARTLGDAGLGWGYGALHATLEGAVALNDFATARDVLNEFQFASLGPKVTTFHAILRPLADSGDGAAALAVLGHVCGEAQALAVAAAQAEEFKANQRAAEIAAAAEAKAAAAKAAKAVASDLGDGTNSSCVSTNSETNPSVAHDDHGNAKDLVKNDDKNIVYGNGNNGAQAVSHDLLLGGQGGRAYQPGNGWWASVAPRPLSPYALAKQQQEQQQQQQKQQQKQSLRQGQQESQLRFPGGARAAAAAQAADEAAELAAKQAYQSALEAATVLGLDCKDWVAPTDPLSIALTSEALLGRSETRPLAEALIRAVLPEAWSEGGVQNDKNHLNAKISQDDIRVEGKRAVASDNVARSRADQARSTSPVLWAAALRVQLLLGNGGSSTTSSSSTNEIAATLQRASGVLGRLTATAVGEGTSFSVNSGSSSVGGGGASSGTSTSESSPLLIVLEALAAKHGCDGRRAGIALLLATIPPHLRPPPQQQTEVLGSGRRRAEEEAATAAACVAAGHFTCAGRAAWQRLAVLCAEAGDAENAIALVDTLNNVRSLAARAEANPLSAASAAASASRATGAGGLGTINTACRAVDNSAAAFVLSELPDRECLSACVVACAANSQIDAALDIVDNLDERGWRPIEAAYVALMRAFGRKLDLPAALGVWSELTATSSPATGGNTNTGSTSSSSANALRVRPSRRAYQAAVDASVTHPSGLRHACSILAKMVTDGYSLSAVHHDTLILGFGQARNLEAALAVFQDQTFERSAVAAASDTAEAATAKSASTSSSSSSATDEAGEEGRNVGNGGRGVKSPTGANTVKVEVSEDVLAALLEAARRNGDADSLDEAVRLLQIYGVEPPAALVRYLAPAQYGSGGPRSALYDRIYGRDGSQAAEATSVAVANLLTARNLARVASNDGQSVIDNAYRDATGGSTYGRGDYGDSQYDGGEDRGYDDYQRRPRRSGQRLTSGDSSTGGGVESATAAAAAEAKARAEATPGRMWTFDGRAATMKLQAVAAQAPPLRLTRGLPLESAIAAATAMNAKKKSSSSNGGSLGSGGGSGSGGKGSGNPRASSVRPLQPMAESAKAGGKGKGGSGGGGKNGGPGVSGSKGPSGSENKGSAAARSRGPKKDGPSDADRKPGGVPSRNKNRR